MRISSRRIEVSRLGRCSKHEIAGVKTGLKVSGFGIREKGATPRRPEKVSGSFPPVLAS
jgi:hypothetical protein